MNLLESFYFIFDADMSGVKKGLKDSDKANEDFGKSLEKTDKVAQKLGVAFVDLAKKATAAVASVAALGTLKKMTFDVADQTNEINMQARALTQSTEGLTAWQHAVIKSGGTAQGATAALTGLRDKFIEIARMGGGMGQDGFMLNQLGISREDMQKGITDPTSALGKLADTFQKLDDVQRQFVGKQLGFDQGTIALLSKGRIALDDILAREKELGVVTAAQAEAATKFKLAQAALGITMDTVGREILINLLPVLQWLFEKTDAFVGFLRTHEGFTKTFFVGMAVVAADVLVPALLAVGAALLPIIGVPLLIGAALAAIALVVDDVNAFMNGQNSVIGELSKKWPILGETVRAAVNVIVASLKLVNAGVADTFKYFMALGDFITDVFTIGPMKALEKFGKKSGELWDDLKAHAKGFGDTVVKSSSDLVDATTSKNAAPSGQVTPRGVAAPGTASARGVPPDVVAAARAAEAKYGVPASVTLAQWALESANGKRMPAGSNNPFGIKAKPNQPFVEAMTTEHINGKDVRMMQKFAKYASLEEAFDAHGRLLAKGSAYANARAVSNDPSKYADALTGKYATDPNYGAKLKAIMTQQSLQAGLVAAQATLSGSTAPVFSQGSGTISNSTRSSSTKVDVGGVTVNTQATDAAGVAREAGKSLGQHIMNAVSYYDDGVAG